MHKGLQKRGQGTVECKSKEERRQEILALLDDDNISEGDERRLFIELGGEIIIVDTDVRWYLNGRRHRFADRPAVLQQDGTQLWYKDGFLHREDDQPAIIYKNGTKVWYCQGEIHRDNGPAVKRADGSSAFYQHGQLQKQYNSPFH